MRPASVGFHCPDDVAMARKTVRAPRTSVGAILRDSPPFVTLGLIAANIAVYVVTGLQSTKGLADPAGGVRPHDLFVNWQLVPILVHDEHSYYRLLTSVFVHENLLHIGLNMVALYVLGSAVEPVLGWWRFLAVYVLAGLGGSVLIYLVAPPATPEIGASGAIYGLFGLALVMSRRLGLDLQWLIGIIVVNFVATFSIANISKQAHIGGFVVGALCGLAIGGLPQLRRRVPQSVQVGGLTAILAALLIAVAVRTGTAMS